MSIESGYQIIIIIIINALLVCTESAYETHMQHVVKALDLGLRGCRFKLQKTKIQADIFLRGTDSSVGTASEKPGVIQMWFQVPGTARDFYAGVNFQCRLSYGVGTAPVCNRMLQHLCAQ